MPVFECFEIMTRYGAYPGASFQLIRRADSYGAGVRCGVGRYAFEESFGGGFFGHGFCGFERVLSDCRIMKAPL